MAGPASTYAPHLVLTMLIGIWSGSFVVAKLALLSLSPFALVAVRFTIATLCVLPFVRGPVIADLRRSSGPGIAAGGVLGAGYFLQMYGVRETTASTGGFLAGLIVILVAIGGVVFFGARFGRQGLLGLGLGLAGIVLVCVPAGDPDDRVDTLLGIGLQLGASVAFAGHILLLSRYGRNQPIAAFTLWQLALISVLGSAATALAGGSGVEPGSSVVWTAELVLLVLYLGVLATALGIGLQARIQHRIPPTHLALLFALQPLFAALCGWALQGDRLSAVQLAGGGLIMAGVVVTSLARVP